MTWDAILRIGPDHHRRPPPAEREWRLRTATALVDLPGREELRLLRPLEQHVHVVRLPLQHQDALPPVAAQTLQLGPHVMDSPALVAGRVAIAAKGDDLVLPRRRLLHGHHAGPPPAASGGPSPMRRRT